MSYSQASVLWLNNSQRSNQALSAHDCDCKLDAQNIFPGAISTPRTRLSKFYAANLLNGAVGFDYSRPLICRRQISSCKPEIRGQSPGRLGPALVSHDFSEIKFCDRGRSGRHEVLGAQNIRAAKVLSTRPACLKCLPGRRR